MEAFLFLIETRKALAVSTLSRHSWQSNAQTVGSGSEMVGSGVGFSNAPENVRTGCASLNADPCATDFAAGASASAVAAPLAPPAANASTTRRAVGHDRLRINLGTGRASGMLTPRSSGPNLNR